MARGLRQEGERLVWALARLGPNYVGLVVFRFEGVLGWGFGVRNLKRVNGK